MKRTLAIVAVAVAVNFAVIVKDGQARQRPVGARLTFCAPAGCAALTFHHRYSA